jgi:erythromycin esterase-like protein
MKRARRLLLLAALLAPTAAGAQQPAPDSALLAALRQNRHTLSAGADGRLEGPGARVLLDAGRESQFFLIGEEHGIAQVPQLAAGLFRGLAPAGYRYLAVETGDAVAAAMNRAVARGDTAMASFVNRNWPGVPFYTLREESHFLAAAVREAGGRTDVLWGLDYDILGDRYALRRLREIAPNAAARAAADRALAAADSMLRESVRTRNLGGIMMFAAPDSAFAPLRRAYAPAPGSEADRILEELEATLRINALQGARRYHEANVTRGGVMKTRFMRRYREAVAAGDTLPRVLLKFGANHAIRGHSFVGFFDLGNAVHELAEMNGGRAFGLMALAGRGTRQAGMDPKTFNYVAGPASEGAWATPLYDLADPNAWTLYDLRPLRRPLAAGRLGTVPPLLARVINGFDALVILSGSGPSTSLAGPPPF